MGSSTACQLAQRADFDGHILVIEADTSYAWCASARSAASIRQQFSSAINIEISLFGIEYLRTIGERLEVDSDRPEIGLTEGGYLFLATADKADILADNFALQQLLGADIGHYDAEGLKAKFPWLNVEDITSGCHGLSGEGWFDGYGLMQAFRKKARSLGVDYIGQKAERIEKSGNGWKVTLGDGSTVDAGHLVNAAGASGGAEICRQAGLDVPVKSRKRLVFPFHCREKVEGVPLLIDPNGTYVRPEGDGFICGSAPDPDNDPDATDFEIDHDFFDEHLWPTLAHRVPAFEAIKPGQAWAGHYDMCLFDHNAFVGAVPGIENFTLALGFSGHGLQQSPAVGRGLAELIATGGYETLDLAALSIERLSRNEPLIERNVV